MSLANFDLCERFKNTNKKLTNYRTTFQENLLEAAGAVKSVGAMSLSFPKLFLFIAALIKTNPDS